MYRTVVFELNALAPLITTVPLDIVKFSVITFELLKMILTDAEPDDEEALKVKGLLEICVRLLL